MLQEEISVRAEDVEAPLTAQAVRAQLLVGLASLAVFAEAVDRTPRQVQTWINQGLPAVSLGRTRYVPIAEASAWLRRGGRA